MPRSLQEVIDNQDEIADWFEKHGPSPESRRPVSEFYLGCIADALSGGLHQQVPEAVAAARRAGASWEQIAEAVGTSATEAEQRFGPAVAQARTPPPEVESEVLGL